VPTPLTRRVAQSLFDAGASVTGSHVVAMCSGGVDSVALVDVLSGLPRGHRPHQVSVLFLDHGLRDVSRDRRCALNVAERHGLTFIERAADGLAGSLQTAAREWRYATAQDIAQELDAAYVATGHHADDQVETMLAALVSSSGLRGAAGMDVARPLGDTQLVRPLLTASRSELEALLVAEGLCWADDPSNLRSEYQRNALRHAVIPGLVAAHPAAGSNLVRSARQFAQTDDALAALARTVLQSATSADGALDIAVLDGLPPGAQHVVIAEWLRAHKIGRGLNERVVRAVTELALGDPSPHSEVSIRGARILRDRYRLVPVATNQGV
jgi:tRNA(Ile)-lysidine synthetase-like protein